MGINKIRQSLQESYGRERIGDHSFLNRTKSLFMFLSLKGILLSFAFISNKDIIKIIKMFSRVYLAGSGEDLINLNKFLEESSLGDIAYRISRLTNFKAFQKIVLNLIVEGLILREPKRMRLEREGFPVPYTLLISPTMRCNLKCKGCYAGNYSIKDELHFDIIDRVISEAEEMGVGFITFLGGEPFIHGRIFDFFLNHPKTYFIVFTNATLIDNELLKKVDKYGNIMPILSLEGFKEETDARRGKGTFDKVLGVMDLMKKAKIPFGYSVTVTRINEPKITSEEFIDLMIEKGALIGWMFLCMPMGREPDMNLLPTPEQRAHMLEFVNKVRATRPIFMIDFWNDAPYVDGCIAGKYYLHITSQGYVEPCIFTHFCQDNIKDKSLKEALNSEFFQELRRRQPFNQNLFLPCMWIDNPEISREIYANLHLQPTHPGADDILTKPDLLEKIDEYSKKMKELYQPIWEQNKCGMEEFFKVKKSVMKLFCN